MVLLMLQMAVSILIPRLSSRHSCNISLHFIESGRYKRVSLYTPQEMKKYEVPSVHWILIREGNQHCVESRLHSRLLNWVKMRS